MSRTCWTFSKVALEGSSRRFPSSKRSGSWSHWALALGSVRSNVLGGKFSLMMYTNSLYIPHSLHRCVMSAMCC